MSKNFQKRDVAKYLKEKLGLDEYRFVSGAGALVFKKKDQRTVNEIIISYRKYPGKIILTPYMIGNRCFEDVFDILKGEQFADCDMFGFSKIIRTIHKQSRRITEIEDFIIMNEEDVGAVIPSFTSMLEEDIKPFFENYPTLESILEKIDELPPEGLTKFVNNPGSVYLAVIKRLLNRPDWEPYILEQISIWGDATMLPNPSPYAAPMFETFTRLYSHLKKL